MSDYADKNELYHWLKGKEKPGHKYTSRYMKNGKWRYVYGAAKNLGDRVKDWWGVDELERLNRATVNYAATGYNDKQKRKKNTVDGTENYNRQKINAKRNAYERAKAEYYKTPMGKLDKAGQAVSQAVSKAASSVSKALNKGSSWVKKQSKKLKTAISSLTGYKEKENQRMRAAVRLAADRLSKDDQYKKTGVIDNDSKARIRAYQRATSARDKTIVGRIDNLGKPVYNNRRKKSNHITNVQYVNGKPVLNSLKNVAEGKVKRSSLNDIWRSWQEIKRKTRRS